MMKKRYHDSQETHVRYHQLKNAKDAFQDMQFKSCPSKIPYKAIVFASLLFCFGSILIVTSMLLLTGYINVEYSDRTWPLLVLGSLMFIPGSYHVHLAYKAWKGASGYSFDDIPDFD